MGAKIINIASALSRMASLQPDVPAIYVPTGRGGYSHATYRELDEHSDAIARGLAAYGIGRGVRTVLMVKPSLEFFALTFGIFKAGAVPVVIDPGIGLKHLKKCLATAKPQAFIGIPVAHAARAILGWGRPTVSRFVTVGRRWFWSGETLEHLTARGRTLETPALAPTLGEDIAAILFTSGSTGPPKGVIYTHANFAAQVEAIRQLYGIEPGEVDLPTFPLFALFDPALGMTTVVPEMDPTRPADVDPAKIISAIKRFGVSNIFGSPALLNRVGRYGRAHGTKLDTVRRVISAGAPVPATVIETFLEMLHQDAQIFTPYGATESLPVASISSREILGTTRRCTDEGMGVCVGKPVASIDLRIIEITDEAISSLGDAKEAGLGEIGEILVGGPQVTSEYVNAPKHNEIAKIDEGERVLHRMGDLGYLDEEGRLWFCGRKSHRVILADQTLYTVPCEGVFNVHEQVFRSALVAVERAGEVVPVLCVELEKNAAANETRRIEDELKEIGGKFAHTRMINIFLFHPKFPVDIRHNAKIGREKLALWAAKQIR